MHLSPDFSDQVRKALIHLHNRSYLASLPLAALLGAPTSPLSGDTLRALLIEAIEQQKPLRPGPAGESDERRYRQLILRYLEGQNRDQVAQALQVSARQASRDHEQAVDLLARYLWGRSQAHGLGTVASGDAERGVGPTPTADAVLDPPKTNAEPTLPVETNLEEVLQGSLATLQALLGDRLVKVDLSIPAILPPVAVDRGLLRQAFLNLLGLASRFIPGGPIQVSAADLVEGIVMRVSIEWDTDDGLKTRRAIGADRDALRLFDLASRLLRNQGVKVEIIAELTNRRTLVMTFPPAPRSIILVVDDNPDMITLFRRYLHGEPYRLVQTVTGERVLRLARELRPRAIILDVLLPTIDGWDVLRQIRGREELREIPILVCSVLPQATLAREFGIVDFLAKPVRRAALLQALHRSDSISAET